MLKLLKNRPGSNYESYNFSSSTICMVLQKFCVQCNKVDIWVSVMFIWTVSTPLFPLLWILFLPFANKSIFNPPSISNLILMSLAADDQLFVNHSLLLCVKYANGGVWHETDISEGASLNWKFSRKCEISSPCKMLIAYYFVEFLYISCNIEVLRASINPYSRKCQKGGNNVSGFAFSCVTLKALLLLDSFPLSSFVGGLDCCKEVIVAHDMNPPIHIYTFDV